jgi:hypothetical protein
MRRAVQQLALNAGEGLIWCFIDAAGFMGQ